MNDPAPGGPALPTWLRPLATAAHAAQPGDRRGQQPPEDGVVREAAVLIAFGESARGPSVLLIQRAADLRWHPGQVAFPGGAVDPDDRDHRATALREAAEEVGLDPATVQIFAALPPMFLLPSSFVVTPVLGWWQSPHAVRIVDLDEVAAVAFVPIEELADPDNRFQVRHPSGWIGAGFEAGGLFIWGFTAGLLDYVLGLAGWDQPWDTTRERPLPPRLARPSSG
jgi:8-oxo-dGTP pyrophosphatase MutT (NUDIX family)